MVLESFPNQENLPNFWNSSGTRSGIFGVISHLHRSVTESHKLESSEFIDMVASFSFLLFFLGTFQFL